MEALKEVVVTKVEEKISNSGTRYYQIDLTEDTGIKSPTGENFKRVWDRLYMPHTDGMESPKMLESLKATVVINFYPQTRTVSDKSYTDIKCNIIRFQ